MPRTGPSCSTCLQRQQISLITLDLNLGKENGLDLARDIRKQRNIPIIMLTGKGDAIDRVVGLELGADDYLAKPFELRELVARIRAVLRRVTPDGTSRSDWPALCVRRVGSGYQPPQSKKRQRRRPGPHHQRVQPAGSICEAAASRIVAG